LSTPHFVQLYWLLMSFIGACTEFGHTHISFVESSREKESEYFRSMSEEAQPAQQFSIPKEKASSDPKDCTPDEIAKYVRYCLSELAGANAHHEFENLCFQLARKRIHPNIMPSTGPVGAGGDQGADFESYEVGDGSGPFFAHASGGKVVFACSIEKNVKKKLKKDVDAIGNGQSAVAKIVFCTNQPVPVAVKHKFQKYSKDTWSCDLEVFDLFAISHLLADPEVFWIATRFLSIPSEIFPVATEKRKDWYQEALDLDIDDGRLPTDQFVKIKRAIRFARFEESLHSDLPKLFEKIRLFRASTWPSIARRAFYEEFVASLRGLEFVADCVVGLREYMGNLGELEAASDIEDAGILISYAVGAEKRRLLDIPLPEIIGWRRSLVRRLDQLLSEEISDGRRAQLLDTKGLALLFGFLDEHSDTGDAQSGFIKSGEAAVSVWEEMLKCARHAPMFPLENVARRLSGQVPEFGEIPGYLKLCEKADKLLAARVGQHSFGAQAFERAKAFSRVERPLEAIDQLHVAHTSALTRETALHTVFIPLFLAKMYSHVGLYAAAKYYALASSFAAVKIGDDELLPYAYRGLAEAAAADYANGASLGFYLSLKAVEFVASEFSASGEEEIQTFEWTRLYFYASILAYGAASVDEALRRYLVDEALAGLGLKKGYEESLPATEKFFEGFRAYPDFAARVIKEGIAPPFADSGSLRRLTWDQLGITWEVEWQNDYRTTGTAEGFVALLQILLCDLRNLELSLLRSDVEIKLHVHTGKFKSEDEPSNTRVIRKVWVPEGSPEWVTAAAVTVLTSVSGYSQETLLRILEGRMKVGLTNKTNPHAPYERLFAEFYSKDDHDTLLGLCRDRVTIPPFKIRTQDGLKGPEGLHKDYDVKKSHALIVNRYRNTRKILKYTLPRLLADERVRAVIGHLRSVGWKDWHILMTMASIRMNYVIQERYGNAPPEKLSRETVKLMRDEEGESDPQPPAALFSLDQMQFAQKLNELSVLKGMGFYCRQRTPVHDAVDFFLRRFNFWTDDVPHDDPFVIPTG
jgi:hypothetical protein